MSILHYSLMVRKAKVQLILVPLWVTSPLWLWPQVTRESGGGTCGMGRSGGLKSASLEGGLLVPYMNRD